MTPTDNATRLRLLLERLTGQEAPLPSNAHISAADLFGKQEPGLGYSQLNELLLSFGYDRVNHQFFMYLVNAKLKYTYSNITSELQYGSGIAIKTLEQFEEGIDEFVKLAMIQFGNVKYESSEKRSNLPQRTPRTLRNRV